VDTSNEINWPDAVWQDINDGVVTEINKVRVAQKVFSTTTFDNHPAQIPNEIINFTDLSIKEGETKPFVDIYVEFTLTSPQVQQETDLKICHKLAIMAAKVVALAEDAYFFQKSDREPRNPDPAMSGIRFPGNIKIDNWRTKDDLGLLAEANPPDADDDDPNKVSEPIIVQRANDLAIWGENTFKAVTDGITKLVAKGQAPNYALFLPTQVYADTFVPPSPASLVTTADRIKPLVEGGFYSSGVLPENEGLLVALGGEPTKLYVGQEAHTEFVRKQGVKYHFQVIERVQYVVRDPRSLVLLKFEFEGVEQAHRGRRSQSHSAGAGEHEK
jgi:uncharacterized linocin/CFP29 family protein